MFHDPISNERSAWFLAVWCCLLILLAVHAYRSSWLKAGSQSLRESSFLSSLRLYLRTLQQLERHEFIADQERLNIKHGATFQTTFLTSRSIYTVAPRNVQAVCSTHFQDWGLEPVRLSALGSFCGRGFLTADGDRWTTVRNTVKPVFRKSAFIDLDVFDAILNEALDKFPKRIPW